MMQPGDYGVPGWLHRVLSDVAAERAAQDAMWGLQEHPDGTGAAYASEADLAKQAVTDAAVEGRLTWRHILHEEVREAFAEDGTDRLRSELIQVAAVAVKWVQDLDRRAQSPGSSHTAPIGEVTSPREHAACEVRVLARIRIDLPDRHTPLICGQAGWGKRTASNSEIVTQHDQLCTAAERRKIQN